MLLLVALAVYILVSICKVISQTLNHLRGVKIFSPHFKFIATICTKDATRVRIQVDTSILPADMDARTL
jgi:hypothetical protein